MLNDLKNAGICVIELYTAIIFQVLLPVLRRRNAIFAGKAFSEVGQVVESAVEGDLCNALIGNQQQFRRFHKLFCLDVIGR